MVRDKSFSKRQEKKEFKYFKMFDCVVLEETKNDILIKDPNKSKVKFKIDNFDNFFQEYSIYELVQLIKEQLLVEEKWANNFWFNLGRFLRLI